MEKINILLDKKLHDATIVSLKYIDNNLYIKVDCTGMNLSKIFPNLDNIYFTIECINISKLNFDFDGMILINELSINKKEKVEIKVNEDLYLECDDYRIIDIKETVKRTKENIMLDKYLKQK